MKGKGSFVGRDEDGRPGGSPVVASLTASLAGNHVICPGQELLASGEGWRSSTPIEEEGRGFREGAPAGFGPVRGKQRWASAGRVGRGRPDPTP